MTTILLQPRPFAKCAGVLLVVPLLPEPKPLKDLPLETWAEIFSYVIESEGSDTWSWSLTQVCKSFYVSADVIFKLILEITTFASKLLFPSFTHPFVSPGYQPLRSSTNNYMLQTRSGILFDEYLIPLQDDGFAQLTPLGFHLKVKCRPFKSTTS